MKSTLRLLALFALILTTGCKKEGAGISSLSQLEGGKTFAAATGTVVDQFILKRFPDAKIEYYPSTLDCVIAVKGGKADAAAYDLPIMKNICARQGGVWVLPELIEDDKYGFAVRLGDTLLKQTIDEVLKEVKADGTYDDMMKRWFPEKGAPAPMPDITLTGTNGVLRFGTAATTEPMAFFDASRKPVGFDVEFAFRVAHKLGKTIEIVDMEFGGMLPALISGKVDMIGAGLSITAERAKKILYSESYYPSGIAVVVKGSAQAAAAADAAAGMLKSEADLADKKIGVLIGSVYDGYASKKFPNATLLQYQAVSDQLVALNGGKIDAVYTDESSVPDVLKTNPGLGVLGAAEFTNPVAAGFNSDNDDLREQFNAFLKEIKANGTYKDMIDRWMTKSLEEMPAIATPGGKGVLRAGVVNDLGMPFGIVKNGEIIGFDIELSKRFAAYTGRTYEPVPLAFGSLIASISTNKIDIITASMFATEEREKMIDFGDPYYQSGASVLARKNRIAPAPKGTLATVNDLAEKKIGIFTGTIYDPFIAKRFPQAQVMRYESTADLMLSLKTGKIDAAMFDLITARLILKHNADLHLLSDDLLSMPLGMGFPKSNPALRKDFNDFLSEIRADGTYDTISNRWLVEDAEAAVMPAFKSNPAGKKLIAGVAVDDLPYVALMNGAYVGFDIELLRTFAERKNYNLHIMTMEFPSLIAALAAGKVNLVTDGIAITEERGKQIDFSDPYAELRTAVVVQARHSTSGTADVPAEPRKSFFTRVADSFTSNLITEGRWRLILDGLWLTILISIFAAITGTLIGGGVCWMRMSANPLLSGAAGVYISLLRGTPVLVLLMIIYYIVFASVNISPAIVAVFAFGLNFGAYVSEMFRTSIQSVDRGQKEAGTAGGFTKVQTFIHIIAPQALKHLLPVYKGEFISLVKMTSIVGYIAVQDLTKASDIIRSRTFDAFFPLIMAALIYLCLAWLLTWGLGAVEISVDPKRRKVKHNREAAQ